MLKDLSYFQSRQKRFIFGAVANLLRVRIFSNIALFLSSLLLYLTVTPLALHNSSAKGEETRYFQFQFHSQLLKTNLLKQDVGWKIWKLPNRMDGTIGEKYIFGEKYFFGEKSEVSKSSMSIFFADSGYAINY